MTVGVNEPSGWADFSGLLKTWWTHGGPEEKIDWWELNWSKSWQIPSSHIVTHSNKSKRGLAGDDLNTATFTPFLSNSSATLPMLSWSPIGTRYSSVSNDPSHRAWVPNLNRHELSAAYWLDRSPSFPSRLLQILHGQSTRVTLSGGKSSMISDNESSLVNAPLLI